MTMVASTSNAAGTGTTMRPRHPTQPNDKLVPATVELDENGNPMFLYQEPTPQKVPPKIVAPRSMLSRLNAAGKRRPSFSAANPKQQTSSGYIDVSMMDLHIPSTSRYQQQGQDVQNENRMGSLHHSLLVYEDEFEDDDDNASLASASSVLSSISGSVSSLKSRVKMRLRRHKRKELEFALSPLKERNGNVLGDNHKDEDDPSKMKKLKNPFKLHRNRRTSTTSCSVTSRSSNSFMLEAENDPLAIVSVLNDVNAVVDVEPLELDTALEAFSPITSDVLHDEGNRTPPPVATLKAAMESASKASQNSGSRRLSEPVVKQPPLQLTPPSRRSSAPVLQKQPVVKTIVPVQAVPKTVGSSEATENRQASSSTAVIASTSDAPTVPKKMSNFKIYLLLLHPASKIFELIQLYFDPSTTTVRDVLSMIPANATEPVLGEQAYTGLCRPNGEDEDEQEISDLDLLIQNHDNMKLSAQVVRGEVLAAIPANYVSKKVVSLSRQIMVNPRICRLLETSRNDPRARKSSKKRHSRRNHRRRHRSARKTVEVLEKHDEEKPSSPSSMVVEESRDDLHAISVTRAMENAMSAAAAANAAITELSGQSMLSHRGYTGSYPSGFLSTSMSGTEGSVSAGSTGTLTANNSLTDASETSFSESYESHSTYSLDNSYSSWSKSFDTSMSLRLDTSSFCLTPQNTSSHFFSPSASRRNKKRMRRVLGVVMTALYVVYWRDPNGYASRDDRFESFGQPLAITGLLQVTLIFLVMVKLQFLCSMPSIESSSCTNKRSKCPFVMARSSIQAGMTSPSKRRFASHNKSYSM